MRSSSKTLLETIGYAAISGMRSMAAIAFLSHTFSRKRSDILDKTPLRFMQSKTAANSLKVSALSEMACDKLPAIPNRIDIAPLSGRAITGALSGALVYKSANKNAVTGALIGAAAAIAASYGMFYLRKTLAENTPIPDAVLGLAEDAIVIGAGIALAKAEE